MSVFSKRLLLGDRGLVLPDYADRILTEVVVVTFGLATTSYQNRKE